MPSSASSSSTSQYDNAKRRYQRIDRTITSGGKRKPAKPDRVAGAGRGRRVLMPAVSLLGRGHSQCNSAPRALKAGPKPGKWVVLFQPATVGPVARVGNPDHHGKDEGRRDGTGSSDPSVGISDLSIPT